MAVVLNVLLIPNFGMNGAAFSHLLSYLTFYLCLLLVVRVKLDINILSLAQVKVVVLVVALLLLNYGWVKAFSPLFMRLSFTPTVDALVDAGVKSLVLMAVSVGVCYHWRISEELNRLIRKALHVK
jgi:O-antigen/teichoic acid export membrane protein